MDLHQKQDKEKNWARIWGWEKESRQQEAPKAVCLKLNISPNILPRDTSIGTKILTLVPPEANTVREVKIHLANFVLRTPSPFHFYVGDYRIRDEENAVIFSLINEPCSLVPVPIPKPALSSTPKLRPSISNDANNSSSGSHKRVTFFDGDSSTSPVRRPADLANGSDVLDHSQRLVIVPSPSQVYVTASTSSSQVNAVGNSNGLVVEGDSSPAEKKKRRRRRHRNKKSKTGSQDSEEEIQSEGNAESATPTNCKDNGTRTRNTIQALDSETESEDETTSKAAIAASEFEFAQPTSSTRKRSSLANGPDSNAKKKKKCSPDSAFSSFDSFTSPSPSSTPQSSSSNGKVRQDTPIVPRVIRNPKTFDNARRILQDVIVPEEVLSSPAANNRMDKNGFEGNSKESGVQAQAERDESSYAALPPVENVDGLSVGDFIAFRVLELDERYNPTCSDFKEAVVTGKNENEITLKYTKNNTIVRCGKYELDDMEDIKDESESTLHFPELLEAKFIVRYSAGATDPAKVEVITSSPPSII